MDWSPFAALIVLAYLVALAIALHLGDTERWRDRITDRFVYGVPWGTIVTIALVLSVYLFVQGGYRHWYEPVVLPFRAWSYLYPVGILTAGFSHSSAGHLIGNLVGTVALAPIAEYAWGHYPGGSRRDPERRQSRDLRNQRGGTDELGKRVTTRVQCALETPLIRAVVAFPAAVVCLGLLTALFAVGPVIGFSGVVFAFGGFAIVRYPITTIVALSVASVVSTTYYALQSPIVRAGISGSAPSPPGWATIAVQGHALGILIGVLLGLALLYDRGVRPDVGRVLLAMLVYGMGRGLWAIYWFEGNGVYVLFRGLGVSLVVLLAVAVAIAATASDRPFPEALASLPRSPTTRQVAAIWLGLLATLVALAAVFSVVFDWQTTIVVAVTGGAALFLALPAIWALSPIELDDLPSGRQTAFGALLAVLILISVPAMLPNLVTVGDDPVPNEQSITVEGYSVTYAEDVRNRMIPAIDLPVVANRTTVPTSGVIVVNEDRHIWTTALSKQYLASEGSGSITVGGVGWRETVDVERSGWSVTGNDSAYAVDLAHDGDTVRTFTSSPAVGSPVIEGHRVAVVPGENRFRLQVYEDGEIVGDAKIPTVGSETVIGPLTLRTARVDDRVTIIATADETRVPIAQHETYRTD
ncbi:rhomboid family intramembrane serine protease [Salinarchaeum laminariae]|uniref:rhomboid family intramembrane serine protease n=1 Tax=Salinarchaeum laminariae TaxID=869888 RepID=UPI0020BECE10|nr:rhomboid family intramembrane serine protease [Salinarchaeum laminariae]